MKGKVLLFHGHGLISALIRWQTRGEVSHAALLYPDGRTIVEAWHSGVQRVPLCSWEGVRMFDVPTLQDWSGVFKFAEAQLGKSYDFVSVARFVDRVKPRPNGRWFCSELVFAAFQSVGINLLERVHAGNVSPVMLSWSPLLK